MVLGRLWPDLGVVCPPVRPAGRYLRAQEGLHHRVHLARAVGARRRLQRICAARVRRRHRLLHRLPRHAGRRGGAARPERPGHDRPGVCARPEEEHSHEPVRRGGTAGVRGGRRHGLAVRAARLVAVGVLDHGGRVCLAGGRLGAGLAPGWGEDEKGGRGQPVESGRWRGRLPRRVGPGAVQFRLQPGAYRLVEHPVCVLHPGHRRAASGGLRVCRVARLAPSGPHRGHDSDHQLRAGLYRGWLGMLLDLDIL